MNEKETHIIPAIVTSYLKKFGCNHAQFITSNDDGDVYSLLSLDKNGDPLPIGLPILIIIKDKDVRVLSGIQAVKYQSSLALED